MTDKTYNGWTNYETWRVNLEIFDGFDYTEHGYNGLNEDDAYELGQYLKEYANELIFMSDSPSSLMEDYARAFLQAVNWREIAAHKIEEVEA